VHCRERTLHFLRPSKVEPYIIKGLESAWSMTGYPTVRYYEPPKTDVPHSASLWQKTKTTAGTAASAVGKAAIIAWPVDECHKFDSCKQFFGSLYHWIWFNNADSKNVERDRAY
jgi:hypothetical protein